MSKPSVELSLFPMAVAISLGVAMIMAPLLVYVWRQLGQELLTLTDPQEIAETKAVRRGLLSLLFFVLALPVAIGSLYACWHTWHDLNSYAQPPPQQREGNFQPTPPDGQKNGQYLKGEETEETKPD